MGTKQSTTTEIFDSTRAVEKKVRFRRQFTPGGHKPNTETNSGISQTVPGLEMSIQEMLARTQRGLPIYSGSTPVYNGERLLPKWKDLDLIDRAAVIKEAEQKVKRDREAKEKAERRLQVSIQEGKIRAEKLRQELQEAQKQADTTSKG